ncbi:MAG: nitroreductase family deazaflavin-dependent oxidoreductase [Miltoncostaeaceae bacterium]
MSMDFKAWNAQIIEEFRANAGKVGGQFEGAPLLLLHTVGAKSGEPRINPLMYLPKGDGAVLFASMAGAPRNPDWYYNVRANPDVAVEIGTETIPMRATVHDEGPERDELYAAQAKLYPQFAEYEASTDRVIPVLVLERR